MIHFWVSPEINLPSYYHQALVTELSSVLQAPPRKPDGTEEGVHVLTVLARWLFDNHAWFKQLKGPRIIVEHDAYLNFMPDSPYYKCWTRLYRHCNFDLIISSGKETTDRLREDGLPAMWVPKGCNKEFLEVDNEFTGEIGYFGKPIAEQETGKQFHFYKSRYEMSSVLEGRLPLMASDDLSFSDMVRKYSATVTDDSTMQEPMAKHFECSAMGCAVIRDRQKELYDLGYEDNVSMASFGDYNEMLEIIEYYQKNPDHLREIQRNAIEVTRGQTWQHRAKSIYQCVKPYLRNRVFA